MQTATVSMMNKILHGGTNIVVPPFSPAVTALGALETARYNPAPACASSSTLSPSGNRNWRASSSR